MRCNRTQLSSGGAIRCPVVCDMSGNVPTASHPSTNALLACSITNRTNRRWKQIDDDPGWFQRGPPSAWARSPAPTDLSRSIKGSRCENRPLRGLCSRRRGHAVLLVTYSQLHTHSAEQNSTRRPTAICPRRTNVILRRPPWRRRCNHERGTRMQAVSGHHLGLHHLDSRLSLSSPLHAGLIYISFIFLLLNCFRSHSFRPHLPDSESRFICC